MLPLAEEIAEARVLVDEAYYAVQLTAGLHMIKFLLSGLVEAPGGRLGAELPGDSFVADSCQRWQVSVPELPPDDAPMSAHVAVRWAQIQIIEALIQPLADVYLERNAALGALVHDQYHLMADPLFEADVLTIGALEAEREALIVDVGPLQAREVAYRVLIPAFEAYLGVIDDLRASGDARVWRGGSEGLRASMASLADALGVAVDPPPLTEDPLEDLDQLERWTAARLAEVRVASAGALAELQDIAVRYAALTEQLQGQTG